MAWRDRFKRDNRNSRQRDSSLPPPPGLSRQPWERAEMPLPPPKPDVPGGLAALLGPAKAITVVDCETTGLYNTDSIVEIGCVTLDATGAVVREFETLINPCRDVGPTWLHGVSATMVAEAPTFADVAGILAELLDGALLAAHNLTFDARMLSLEFGRLGAVFAPGVGVDTLRATGESLSSACETFGLEGFVPHRALSDARATAALLLALASDLSRLGEPASVSPVQPSACALVRRDAFGEVIVDPPSYSASLRLRMAHPDVPAAMLAYSDALDLALLDRTPTGDEFDQLHDYARVLGLDDDLTAIAERRYLDGLVEVARADGEVDAEEYADLKRVATALGLDIERVNRATEAERSRLALVELHPGMRVAFTGAAVDAYGERLARTELIEIADAAGFVGCESFTKSCDLLVAADPASASGKAAKARRYSIPIVAAADFLAASPGDSIPAMVIAVAAASEHRCPSCGSMWLRDEGDRRQQCPDCRTSPTRTRSGARQAAPVEEALVCQSCGASWSRMRTRGRKPRFCPDCATG